MRQRLESRRGVLRDAVAGFWREWPSRLTRGPGDQVPLTASHRAADLEATCNAGGWSGPSDRENRDTLKQSG